MDFIWRLLRNLSNRRGLTESLSEHIVAEDPPIRQW